MDHVEIKDEEVETQKKSIRVCGMDVGENTNLETGDTHTDVNLYGINCKYDKIIKETEYASESESKS